MNNLLRNFSVQERANSSFSFALYLALGFVFRYAIFLHDLKIRHVVLRTSVKEIVYPLHLGRVLGHNQLADFLMRYVALTEVIVRKFQPFHAKFRLQSNRCWIKSLS